MDIVTYALLNGKIKNYASNVGEWLEENVDPATGYVLDRSLQMANAAAPADMVGDISDTVSDVRNTLNNAIDQVENNLEEIEDITNNYNADKTALTPNGLINPTTGEYSYIDNSAFHVTDFISLVPNVTYKFELEATYDGEPNNNARAFCVYKADKTYSRSIGPSSYSGFSLTGTERFIRINVVGQTVETFNIYESGISKLSYNVKDSLPIDLSASNKYEKSRKATVAFIIDGDFDLNANMVGIAERNGVKIGIAPPYTTTFAVNPLSDYLLWQKMGHELLVHSAVNVGQGTPYTDAEIREIIEDAYETMVGYGFDLHGFVAYQGNGNIPVTIDATKNHFDYASNCQNTYGSSESNMWVYSATPYTMFRYSMQLSTLAEQKAAVDRCKNTRGLLVFYGHAESANTDYFTQSNFEELIQYIKAQGIQILKPYDAVQYFDARSQDYSEWEDISITPHSKFTVVTSNCKRNRNAKVVSLNIRIKCTEAFTETGPALITGIPYVKTLLYPNTNDRTRDMFLYENMVMTQGSASYSLNENIYISATYYSDR